MSDRREGMRTPDSSPSWDDGLSSGRWSPLRLLQAGSILVPAAIILVWGLISWNGERNRTFDWVEKNAELLRAYALRVFETQQSLLVEAEYLLGDVDVVAADQAELHEKLQPLIGRLRLTLGVGIIAPSGEIVGSTTYPISGTADHRTYFQKLRDGEADLYIERVTLAQDQEALLVAQRRPGSDFMGVLVAAVDLDAVAEFFARVAESVDASASLVGLDGSLLLTHPPRSAVTLPEGAPLMVQALQSTAGSFEAAGTFDGLERIYGFNHLGEFPAFVVFGEASRTVVATWWSNFLIVVVLLSIAGALAFTATTQALRRLGAEAQQRRLAFDRRLLAEAELAAESRGALLREAHHRIKNNLQMILGMLHNKAAALGDSKMLSDIENRILALSELHDHLHAASDDGSTLDLGNFLEAISRNPSIVPPEQSVAMVCDVAPLTVKVSQAVPVALIAVEAITNSLKHAFSDGRPGRIDIHLRQNGDEARISIKDNGTGLPPAEDRSRNSGLRLLDALARQLDGRLDIVVAAGTEIVLHMPIADRFNDGVDQKASDPPERVGGEP